VFRRLAAMVYDLLLLAALWMTATFVLVIGRGGAPVPPGNLPYQLLLAAITAGFFIGFWLRGGQTLGMRAWRLRVALPSGAPLDVRTAVVRLAAGLVSAACLGAGLFWLWIDRDGLAWHDRAAGTRVVVLPKSGG
jgi:uncharacterized RDD family membrane protein YckC